MGSFYRAASLCISALFLLSLPITLASAQDTTFESDDDCFPPDSEFATHRCSCDSGEGGRIIACESNKKLTEFPVLNSTMSYPKVTVINVREQEFSELRKEHLDRFPNLEEINFSRGRISKIENDAFDGNPKLHTVEIQNNQLTIMPPVRGLQLLERLYIHDNDIQSLKPGDLEGCYSLTHLEAPGNDIRELEYGVFKGLCNLYLLDLNDNRRLSTIEDDVFEDTVIHELRLQNTDTDKLPSNGLRRSLYNLYMKGTYNLKRFNAYESGVEFHNQTYPLLRTAEFSYHAHCCQMSDHSYFVPRSTAAVQKSEVFSSEGYPIAYDTSTHVEFKRSVTDALAGYVCVNTSDNNNVIDDTSSIDVYQNVSASEFCSSAHCIESVCGNGCSLLEMGSLFSGAGISDILCIQIAPSSCLDRLYSEDNTTSQVTTSTCTPEPSPEPSPTTTGIPEPSMGPLCPFDPCSDPDDWCACDEMSKETCDTCQSFECDAGDHCAVDFPELCDCHRKRSTEKKELLYSYMHDRNQRTKRSTNSTSQLDCAAVVTQVICRERLSRTNESSQTSLNPVSTPAPSPQMEWECNFEDPDMIGELLLPSGWFYPDLDSKEMICSEIPEQTTATTTQTVPMPTDTPTIQCRVHEDIKALVKGPLTQCEPEPNNFNPCEDLLGESDFLRSAIWFVIILALLGNGMILFVFFAYAVIIRRTKIKFFPMHFLYANLAMADFLMSVYLLTITSVDAHTVGHFSEEDIEWRTGPGCGFAGFCAITSTAVSVYTLVVITSERLYTITFVMHRRKMSKIFALGVMVIGWIFGVILGILPLVEVNNYSVVAICLPFDTSTRLALGYIIFILLLTGLAFVYIAISYAILFYQIVLSPAKRKLVRSGGTTKQWKADLRMSVRMFLLVATNFICWFPIALVSLTAAFDVPLQGIDVRTAKIFMVFVFPLNACVNPFLYTLSTKAFKENLLLLLSKCGILRGTAHSALHSRIFGIPSGSSNRTSETVASRRGSVFTHLLAFTARRTSFASQETNSDLNLRRPSQFSMSSNEDNAGPNSTTRRNSTFSQNSNEDQVPVGPNFRSLKDEKFKPKHMINSASSLGVLQELDEVSDLPNSQSSIRLNPGYQDQNDSTLEGNIQDEGGTHTSFHNGYLVGSTAADDEDSVAVIVNDLTETSFTQHQIVADVLEAEEDSEEQSDTTSVPDEVPKRDLNSSKHDPDQL